MSTSCSTSATATTTSVFTTDSTSTSFSTSLSTEPPSVTTITTQACALGSSDILCLSTATTITSTLPGIVTTITVPVTKTVPITSSETLTLFGSSCTVINTSLPSLPSIPSIPSLPASSGSGTFSMSTPDPIVITSQSASTLANGQVTAIMETITTTQPPSVVYVGPSSTSGSNQAPQNNPDNSSSPNIGAIVGGVVGGFFGLIGIVLVIWFVMKRRRRWDDIFDKEDTDIAPPRRPRTTKRFSLDAEIEPKPYQYGLVGQSRSPPIGISPPSSPPSLGLSHPPGRQHTLTPLQLPTSASTPGLSAGTTISSRPSTAGSMRPLRDAPASPPLSGHTHNHTTSSGSSTSVHVSPALPSHWGHHSPSPSAGPEYFDRVGSPTSVRDYEPSRRLQLANVEDEEAAGPGPALLDGKGRHVRLGSGGPGVLVHTDAGPAPSGFQP
ncbi:hypothetical protein C8R44DRAFT_847932 [Mycena epipterygia]|nr:hypothetical protein C8R44DRAFT_847932 [Mycena epipterygia]